MLTPAQGIAENVIPEMAAGADKRNGKCFGRFHVDADHFGNPQGIDDRAGCVLVLISKYAKVESFHAAKVG